MSESHDENTKPGFLSGLFGRFGAGRSERERQKEIAERRERWSAFLNYALSLGAVEHKADYAALLAEDAVPGQEPARLAERLLLLESLASRADDDPTAGETLGLELTKTLDALDDFRRAGKATELEMKLLRATLPKTKAAALGARFLRSAANADAEAEKAVRRLEAARLIPAPPRPESETPPTRSPRPAAEPNRSEPHASAAASSVWRQIWDATFPNVRVASEERLNARLRSSVQGTRLAKRLAAYENAARKSAPGEEVSKKLARDLGFLLTAIEQLTKTGALSDFQTRLLRRYLSGAVFLKRGRDYCLQTSDDPRSASTLRLLAAAGLLPKERLVPKSDRTNGDAGVSTESLADKILRFERLARTGGIGAEIARKLGAGLNDVLSTIELRVRTGDLTREQARLLHRSLADTLFLKRGRARFLNDTTDPLSASTLRLLDAAGLLAKEPSEGNAAPQPSSSKEDAQDAIGVPEPEEKSQNASESAPSETLESDEETSPGDEGTTLPSLKERRRLDDEPLQTEVGANVNVNNTNVLLNEEGTESLRPVETLEVGEETAPSEADETLSPVVLKFEPADLLPELLPELSIEADAGEETAETEASELDNATEEAANEVEAAELDVEDDEAEPENKPEEAEPEEEVDEVETAELDDEENDVDEEDEPEEAEPEEKADEIEATELDAEEDEAEAEDEFENADDWEEDELEEEAYEVEAAGLDDEEVEAEAEDEPEEAEVGAEDEPLEVDAWEEAEPEEEAAEVETTELDAEEAEAGAEDEPLEVDAWEEAEPEEEAGEVETAEFDDEEVEVGAEDESEAPRTPQERMRARFADADELTLAEAMEYAAEETSSYDDQTQLALSAIDFMVRVSDDLYVADRRLHFDVKWTDRAIKAALKIKKRMPLRMFADALDTFPDCGRPWTFALLESYVRRFSVKYRLVADSFSSNYTGIVVPVKSPFRSERQIIYVHLRQNGLVPKTREANAWLLENGYLCPADNAREENAEKEKERGTETSPSRSRRS